MELNNILDIIINQGVFCILFVYFYIDNNKKVADREQKYIDRENKYIEQVQQGYTREVNYQNIINDMTDRIIPTLEKIESKLGGE